MGLTPTVFADATSLGRALAERISDEIAAARRDGRRYVFGCPAGRTPRTTYAALACIVAQRSLDIRHVVIVMMDEYVGADCCRRFGEEFIVRPLGIAPRNFWVPDPQSPERYERRLEEIGGVDRFILASGASDGHVAFNPPGSARDSVTRVVRLAETTRADNLSTFPSLGSFEQVPRYGVTVGIGTIRRHTKRAVMLAHGRHKAGTVARVCAADRYDPEWPATVLTEFAEPDLFVDRAARG